MTIIVGQNVFVVIAENLGYENLEKYKIEVFDTNVDAEFEQESIIRNPNFKWLMTKKCKIRRKR